MSGASVGRQTGRCPIFECLGFRCREELLQPEQGNDRLLLGLKGSLNEYELDLLRQRS
jgi:hypothetical protein